MTEILTLLCVVIGFVFLPCVVLYLLFPVIQYLRKESKIDIDKAYESAQSAKLIIDKYIELRQEIILQRRKEKARNNPEYTHYTDYPTE